MDETLFQKKLDAINFKPLQCKKMLLDIPDLIFDDEEFLWIVEGFLKHIHNRPVKNSMPGLMVVTSKRVFFYRKSLIGTISREDLPISNIASASFRKGLLMGSIIISTSNDMAEVDNIGKIYGEPTVNIIMEAHKKSLQAPQSPTITPTTPADNKFEMLEKLHELKTKGILTDEEYLKEKTRLLA